MNLLRSRNRNKIILVSLCVLLIFLSFSYYQSKLNENLVIAQKYDKIQPAEDKNIKSDHGLPQEPATIASTNPILKPEVEHTLPTFQSDGSADVVKQAVIKQMIKKAWQGYADFAFGQNELRPITKAGHTTSIFGGPHFGATIIDSLDTLWIADLKDEYEKAKNWVLKEFDFNGNYQVSVFEINIRFLGGLLSAYALTGEKGFLDKAVHIGGKLLPAFNSPSGFPYALVRLDSGETSNWGWSASSSIIAEFGTLSMEFRYLSYLSQDTTFAKKIDAMYDKLRQLPRPDKLYPNYVQTVSGRWGQKSTSIGGLGDSFYEYLYKAYLQSGKTDSTMKGMYDEAMKDLMDILLQTSTGGNMYFAESRSGRLTSKMDHLGCFIAGLIGLSAQDAPKQAKSDFLRIANGVGETCHLSYNSSATRIGPEAFHFAADVEAKALRSNEKSYILRPEVIESYFVLWRVTKDPKWRAYGWEAAQAIEKHCGTENGYSGIRDVYQDPATKDDVQQSFFMAETLKYLYLLFSDDSVIPIDQYVFNTEAHPLPIIPDLHLKATKTT